MSSQQRGDASGPRHGSPGRDTHNDGEPQAPPSAQQPTSTTQPPVAGSWTMAQAGPAPPSAPNQSLPGFSMLAGDRGLTRSLGVHSILNPPHAELQLQQGRRRTASEMELSSISEVDPRSLPAPPARLEFADSGRVQSSPVTTPGGLELRHTMGPRSPGRRVNRLSLFNPSATIDVRQSPFLSPPARMPMTEGGASFGSALPTPPAASRLGYNFPPPPAPTPPLSTGRRASAAAVLRTQSASASPSTSYSSYSYTSQTSPAGPMPPMSGANRSASYGTLPSLPATTHGSGGSVTLESDRPYGIAMASSGQSSYQILTLETNQGPVQVPVDVQAASRVADEKRKRNAGASARFRQRRKEKEREASTTISRLEQQVRDATEDAEFYKRERDTLGNLLYQTPGGDRHFPRPQSPRHTRVSLPPSTGSAPSTGSSGSTAFPAFPESSDLSEHDRRVRRRTSAYSLPTPTQATQMGYPPHTFAPLIPTSSGQSTAPARQGSTTAPPSQMQPAPARSAQYDPFQAERLDRNWPPPPQREGR